MRFSFKSNRPRIQLTKLTDAEKQQAQLVSSMKRTAMEERKAASMATNIATGLAERGRPSIVDSFRLGSSRTLHRRSKSVMPSRRNNTTTRSKKNKSADDLIQNQVANDLTRYGRAKVKQNTKTESLLDRIHNMPLDVQGEIYSWIGEPKTQRPEISNKEVRNRFERIHLLQLMRDKKIDEWVYAQADDAFDDEESTFSGPYNTSMFKTKYRGGLPYISHNGKVFAKSFEEFKAKTRIEYSVTGDYIRFRVLPKMLKSDNESDYDGFIVPDTFLDHLEPRPNGGPWYEIRSYEFEGRPDLYPEFDNRTRTFVRRQFDHIDKRSMDIHLLRFHNMPSKLMIVYLPYSYI